MFIYAFYKYLTIGNMRFRKKSCFRLEWGIFLILSIILLCFMSTFSFADSSELPIGTAKKVVILHDSMAVSDHKNADECIYKDCDDITGIPTDYYDNDLLCCAEEQVTCYLGLQGDYEYVYVVLTHEPNDPDIVLTYSNPLFAYTIDYDDVQYDWACNDPFCGNYVFDYDAFNNVGACCGDDPDDDPDMGADACSFCPKGLNGLKDGIRHWDNLAPIGNQCCGDDGNDCRQFASDYQWVCSDVPETALGSNLWYWKNAEDTSGLILDSTCGVDNISFLSDGDEWITCYITADGKKFDLTDVGNPSPASGDLANPYNNMDHGYLCYNEGQPLEFKTAECCGGGGAEPMSCVNDATTTNNRLVSGNSIDFTGKSFFCTENFTFSEDLDEYSYACDNALYPNGSSRDYMWTGTKCCSEPQDWQNQQFESYNDENGSAACFQSEYALSGWKVEGHNELVVTNAVLRGCAINEAKNSTNDWLLSLTDYHTGGQLIDEFSYCELTKEREDSTTFFYCDYSEEWKITTRNMTNLIYIPDNWRDPTNDSIIDAGCCEPDMCWSGTECHPNYAGNPLWGPYKDNLRCSEGDWVYSEYKKGIYDGIHGYCPRNDQCLVRATGGIYEENGNTQTDANPYCIEDGQYIAGIINNEFIGDYYCDGGNWSSRTKILGLSLLDLVGLTDDYKLYCGPYSEILPYYNYMINFIDVKREIFDEGVANNVCLLEYNGKVIFATSYNPSVDVNIQPGDLLPEFANCNFSNGEGFTSCNVGNMAWFNSKLNTLFYSNQAFTLNQNITFNDNYNSFIRTDLTHLFSVLEDDLNEDPFNYDFKKEGLRFDRLYSVNQGDVNIFASLDESNLIVYYEGIDSNKVCDIIAQYNLFKTDKPLGFGESPTKIACVNPYGKNYIIAYGSFGADIDPYSIWADLTGKLRIN